jgi:aminoglycoside 6'-N-acetyltransferase
VTEPGPGGVVLTDGDVCVRSPRESDRGALVELFADPLVERWWGRQEDPRLTELIEGRAEVLGLVVEHAGRPVGWIQVLEEESAAYRHAGLDVATIAAVHGTGVPTRALTLVRDWLVGPKGHRRLTTDPAASNDRAVAAYRKIGFRDVGVMRGYERTPDGSFHDALLMEYVVGLDGPAEP